MYYASADVQHAFYQHRLPKWLSPYFSLAPVRAGELGIRRLDGAEVSSDVRLFPQLQVVPMGWSWGVHLIQEAHSHILASSALLPSTRCAVDFQPPPLPGPTPAHALYIDNLCIFGTCADAVDAALEAGVGAWKSAGLESHEIVRSNQVAQNLGEEQRGGPPSSGITAKRCALLRAGIRWLLDHRGACTSAEMGHLVGHLTFALLFRRESLACLRAVYDWIARDYTVETPLWDSVRRELGIAVGLLVL